VAPPSAQGPYTATLAAALAEGRVRIYLYRVAGRPAGRVSAFDYNPRNRSLEFGYYMPAEWRGLGHGGRMVAAFLAAAFADRTWPCDKVCATTAEGNVASRRLLERLNFHLDGRMREHYRFPDRVEDQYVYSLMRREWTGPGPR
jgi:ribosomal-protein-alanine N-acetyltransferase